MPSQKEQEILDEINAKEYRSVHSKADEYLKVLEAQYQDEIKDNKLGNIRTLVAIFEESISATSFEESSTDSGDIFKAIVRYVDSFKNKDKDGFIIVYLVETYYESVPIHAFSSQENKDENFQKAVSFASSSCQDGDVKHILGELYTGLIEE
jgi:hypothetical protein